MADKGGGIHLGILIVIMLVIYLFFDSSFPLLYFALVVLGLYFYNKNFPISHLLFILICIYFLFYMVKSIFYVLNGGCGKHKPGLVIERFANETDSSLAYFKRLSKRVNELDASLDKSNAQVDAILDKFNKFQADICYVTNQIDDGIEGNYASNVPDDERLLPAKDQKLRSDERKKKAKAYVKNLKNTYSESNKKIPLVECFEATTDDVDFEKQSLLDNLDLVQGKFKNLTDNLTGLKKTLNEKQISMYYVSLRYNDKYLKQLLKAATNPTKEGFTSKADPASQIETLESDYQLSIVEIAEIQKNVDKFIEIVNLQKEGLKQAKGPAVDPDIQASTINSSYMANRK
jgi:hypothetical protein